MARVKVDLHEAMVLAMVNRRQFRMLAQDLADAVREDGRYLRGDGKSPPTSQILSRAQNKTYKDLFEVKGPKGGRVISLRSRAGANM